MNTGQLMIIGPGENEQQLHRDAENWPSLCHPEGFEATVSCMFALLDFTVAAGATRVVPGSHRWDDYDRTPELHEVGQVVMPAGSGMLYTGRAMHGAGAITTANQFRYGMHLSYVLCWLTPEEAGPLGASWDDVRDLSPRAQRPARLTLQPERAPRPPLVDHRLRGRAGWPGPDRTSRRSKLIEGREFSAAPGRPLRWAPSRV